MQTVSMSRQMREAPLDPQEQARADWYGLLATLFQQPPSAELLKQIASAPSDTSTALGREFSELVQACALAESALIRQEFDTVFLGVGRPEVFLQASYYLTGFLHERPLSSLRERMAGLGVIRGSELSLTEDHVGVLCELMRFLIAAENSAPTSVAVQKEIFNEYIAPCFEALCDAIERSESGNFYRQVGRVAKEFFSIEQQAFDFLV